jgi:magnesium chelatase family protein
MYGQISTLAFIGIEARPVEVQVRVTPGAAAFAIVGLPDKAVAESRERVRNALHAVGLGLPFKHITVNLAPADLPKEGSHFDLPIVLAMMSAMEAIAPDAIAPTPRSASWRSMVRYAPCPELCPQPLAPTRWVRV